MKRIEIALTLILPRNILLVCSLLSPQSHHYTIENRKEIRRILLRLFMTMFAVFWYTFMCRYERRVRCEDLRSLSKIFFDAFQLA
jgi:hypothetical protein